MRAGIGHTCHHAITELDPAGHVLGIFIAKPMPDGIAIDASGDVWVTNLGSSGTAGTAVGESNVSKLIC